MWKQIKLIGRDRVLASDIRPRLKEGRGFVISGGHGSGKTAVLEWIKDNTSEKIALVSAQDTVRDMLRSACRQWDLIVTDDDGEEKPASRWQVAWMERAIYGVSGLWLIVDDIHSAAPALLRRLKLIQDRCKIIASAVPPITRQETRRLLWGMTEIKLKPLKQTEMKRIGEAAAVALQSRTAVMEAVHAARGMPGHLIAALRGEVTPGCVKTKGEEIDISPLILVGLAGIMVTRYIAMGIESTSIYILAGIGMGAGLIVRFYLFRGMKK